MIRRAGQCIDFKKKTLSLDQTCLFSPKDPRCLAIGQNIEMCVSLYSSVSLWLPFDPDGGEAAQPCDSLPIVEGSGAKYLVYFLYCFYTVHYRCNKVSVQ